LSQQPVLYIFAGLPGTGKTTLAKRLAQRVNAAYVRIDTFEQALRDLCSVNVLSEGYGLAYRVAADNLSVGISVVADSCNPIELTRRAWERVAAENGAHFVNIEVICSDRNEHCQRVESRASSVSGLRLPSWSEVEAREYHRWSHDRIVLDTSGRSESTSFDELLSELSRTAR
jgi:predicted kinase